MSEGGDWPWDVDDDQDVAGDGDGAGAGEGGAGGDGEGGGAGRASAVVDWWALSPADRLAELDDLRLFVGRLVAVFRWDEGVVPPCWERHEAAVRMLDALRCSYAAATGPASGGFAATMWLRDLAFVRDELRGVFRSSSCRGSHNEAVWAAGAQAWALDVSERGRESDTWRRGRAEAVEEYRRALEAQVEAQGSS